MVNLKKPCGECYMCCTSILQHEVYGQKIGNGVDCRFISNDPNERCSIYDIRPEHCSGFSCLWQTQESWPDYMQPIKSGIVAFTNKKYGIQVIFTKNTTVEAKEFVEKYFSERKAAYKKIINIKFEKKENF